MNKLFNLLQQYDTRGQTALDLAEDLRRVGQSEPIRARPVSVFGRAARWARRRPASRVRTPRHPTCC